MRRIIILLLGAMLLLMLFSCDTEYSSEDFYLNTNFILVDKKSNGEILTMVIKTIDEPHKFRILTNESTA